MIEILLHVIAVAWSIFACWVLATGRDPLALPVSLSVIGLSGVLVMMLIMVWSLTPIISACLLVVTVFGLWRSRHAAVELFKILLEHVV